MSTIPKFYNKPNLPQKTENGDIVWQSRSVAIIGVVLLLDKYNNVYVLSEKRSEIMDEPNKWCVPCGYLDWDENGWDCLRREIYEETSLLIDDYKKSIVFNNDQSPFFINTSPTDHRQNVTLSYVIVITIDEPDEFLNAFKNHQNSEVTEVKWINIHDILKYTWAFNHESRINMAIKYVLNNV